MSCTGETHPVARCDQRQQQIDGADSLGYLRFYSYGLQGSLYLPGTTFTDFPIA